MPAGDRAQQKASLLRLFLSSRERTGLNGQQAGNKGDKEETDFQKTDFQKAGCQKGKRKKTGSREEAGCQKDSRESRAFGRHQKKQSKNGGEKSPGRGRQSREPSCKTKNTRKIPE